MVLRDSGWEKAELWAYPFDFAHHNDRIADTFIPIILHELHHNEEMDDLNMENRSGLDSYLPW